MAWRRTARGLMVPGFVSDQFGLILRRVIAEAWGHLHPKAFSFRAGTVLVMPGAMMPFLAAARYLHYPVSCRHERDTSTRHGIVLGVIFSATIGLFGRVIAAFLLAAT